MSAIESFLPGLSETAEAFVAVGPVQALAGSGALLWLILLSLPLRGIDRRDWGAGVTYVLFHVATGTALVLGLSRGLSAERDVLLQLAAILALGSVAGVRWSFIGRWRQPPAKLQAGTPGKESAP